MDWKVKVVTSSNQVKDIVVYDYTYPSDAVKAAMSQTNAKSVISYSPFVENKTSSQRDNESEISDGPTSYFYHINLDFLSEAEVKSVTAFVLATLPITIILWIIHPIPSILFTIAFARWWFTD
jgi:hypothetical protein